MTIRYQQTNFSVPIFTMQQHNQTLATLHTSVYYDSFQTLHTIHKILVVKSEHPFHSPASAFLFLSSLWPSSLLDSSSNPSSLPPYPLVPRVSHPPCWTSSSAPAGEAGRSSCATAASPSALHAQPHSSPCWPLLVNDRRSPASCFPMMLAHCSQTWLIWMSLVNVTVTSSKYACK